MIRNQNFDSASFDLASFELASFDLTSFNFNLASFNFTCQILTAGHSYNSHDILYGSKDINSIGLSKNKINVFDTSQNREDPLNYKNMVNLLEKHDWPYLILSSEPHQNANKICYYPYYLYAVEQSNLTTDIALSRPYKFGSLNRNAHAHRIWLYFNLTKNLDSCLYTWNNTPGDPAELAELDPELLAQCQKLPSHPVPDTHSSVRTTHPVYLECYVDICTETMMRNETFISEKTWKPIAAGQLFLIAGGVGTIEYLRNQGIDVFDDYIDHSYDAPGSWQERISVFADSVKKLAKKDLDKIWLETVERRQSNRDIIASKRISKFYVNELNLKAKLYYPELCR